MRFDKLAILLCLALGAVAGAAYAQQPASFGKGTTVPVCANCHESQHLSIMLTAHGAKNDADGSMCQACHGDASAHLKDPMKAKPANVFKKGASTAAQKDAICQNCHASNRHLAFWESGKHAKNEVSCSNCHNMHGKPGVPVIAPFTTSFRPNEADLCGTCHMQIRTATLKPSHHPIIENKMKCSDCHNPHGALTPVMLRAETVNQQCYSCHADKRGPYMFGHPPVEDNCITCHNPHGSVYARLLNEKVPNLCQDCHDAARHPGTVYGAAGMFNCQPGDTSANCAGKTGQPNPGVSTRLVSRSCTNCHSQIHGSNAPGNRGKYFIR